MSELGSEFDFRIFISSTHYNLRDLRAELSLHLRDLGYRPILSSHEGFQDGFPDVEPWEACLRVLETSFLMILVLDGRYSQAFEWPHYREALDGRRLSPTHAEYLYAHKRRMRMLVFVRDELMHFYEPYRKVVGEHPNDPVKAKATLAAALPARIDFEALQFLAEVKTTHPIPWIREFGDVTHIKSEVQKKLLNELAQVFLLRSLHLKTVVQAFSQVLETMGPEEKRKVLLEIGYAKELIEKLERDAEEVVRLRKEEALRAEELKSARAAVAAAKADSSGRIKLEKKVASLQTELDTVKKQRIAVEGATRFPFGGVSAFPQTAALSPGSLASFCRETLLALVGQGFPALQQGSFSSRAASISHGRALGVANVGWGFRCSQITEETGALDAEINPLFVQGAQLLVAVELRGRYGQVLLAHELGVRAAAPGEVELMIGAVLLGRIGFAPAARGTADVVLARDRSGTQRPELGEGALDLGDAAIDLLEGAHEGGSVARRRAREEGGLARSR